MKKTIGIPGYTGRESNNFGVGNTYMELASKFGNVRIIMPWEEFLPEIDLLLLPGGLDTNPSFYGEIPSYKASNQDVFKEHFFRNKLKSYIDNNTPIIGICLGAQMLAAYFGCKLVQDLLYHEQSSSRWSTAHKVYTNIDDMYLKNKTDKPKGVIFSVNSHHHQALTLNNITDNIKPVFFSKNHDTYITGDGPIVEAFTIINRPIVGIQWHPEELYDTYTINTFKHLLNLVPKQENHVPLTRMA